MSADDDEFQLDFSDHLDLLISAAESGGQKGVRDARILISEVARHLRYRIEIPPNLADYMVRCLDRVTPTLSDAEPIEANKALNLKPGRGRTYGRATRESGPAVANYWDIAMFVRRTYKDGGRTLEKAYQEASEKFDMGEKWIEEIYYKRLAILEEIERENAEPDPD